jgi:hypothetical protein
MKHLNDATEVLSFDLDERLISNSDKSFSASQTRHFLLIGGLDFDILFEIVNSCRPDDKGPDDKISQFCNVLHQHFFLPAFL